MLGSEWHKKMAQASQNKEIKLKIYKSLIFKTLSNSAFQ